MRQAGRVTLFVQDRSGGPEPTPDLELVFMLLQQAPLVSNNPDGSRTYVYDLDSPGEALERAPKLERLRGLSLALGQAARALGLPLTAALADSAEIVAEAEAPQPPPPASREPALRA